jgi:hypothetical protein
MALVLNFKLPRVFPTPSHLSFFVAELYFAYYNWLGLVKSPDANEETSWCEWLQQNLNGVIKKPPDLNGDHDAPPDPPPTPSAGQYSIEVIVGWSRRRILVIVVIPFILFLTCTTAFAILWSFHLRDHHSSVGAGFSIASYFASLAAGELSARCLIPMLAVVLSSFCCSHWVLWWQSGV